MVPMLDEPEPTGPVVLAHLPAYHRRIMTPMTCLARVAVIRLVPRHTCMKGMLTRRIYNGDKSATHPCGESCLAGR